MNPCEPNRPATIAGNFKKSRKRKKWDGQDHHRSLDAYFRGTDESEKQRTTGSPVKNAVSTVYRKMQRANKQRIDTENNRVISKFRVTDATLIFLFHTFGEARSWPD
jgi:hypothetical protein